MLNINPDYKWCSPPADSHVLVQKHMVLHFVSRTHTSTPSALEVSCSLSLRRCLLKAGWSIRVYEEKPAPFCIRKPAISSLPATQNTLLTQAVLRYQRWPGTTIVTALPQIHGFALFYSVLLSYSSSQSLKVWIQRLQHGYRADTHSCCMLCCSCLWLNFDWSARATCVFSFNFLMPVEITDGEYNMRQKRDSVISCFSVTDI